MDSLLLKLRNTTIADRAYRAVRNRLAGPGWGAFHRDRIYRAMMLDLLDALAFTSFVETGTYRGYSTELIASRYRALPVFTVEVLQSTWKRSSGFLQRYRNVDCLLGSSDAVLKQLLDSHRLGDMPLYFLDAHWQQYWPLRSELAAIGQSGATAVIVIDDFEVPGRPQFGFDIDGGADITAGQKCNLDYITPALPSHNSYYAAFPRYSPVDAFGPPGTGQLRGHIVLFQNLPEQFQQWVARPLATQYYQSFGTITAGWQRGPLAPSGG